MTKRKRRNVKIEEADGDLHAGREDRTSDTEEEADPLPELDNELPDGAWEEVHEDGTITVHYTSKPKENVETTPKESTSFQEAGERRAKRFARIFAKAKMNSTTKDSVIDMSIAAGIGDKGAKWVWGPDEENGTHEVSVRQVDGKVQGQFKPIEKSKKSMKRKANGDEEDGPDRKKVKKGKTE